MGTLIEHEWMWQTSLIWLQRSFIAHSCCWVWQCGAWAEPPLACCVSCCMCAHLSCCGSSSNKSGVTLLIFLGGVCSTRSSLCIALLFFLGNKPPLYVVFLIVSTFSLLLCGVFLCFFKCEWLYWGLIIWIFFFLRYTNFLIVFFKIWSIVINIELKYN